LIKNTRTLADRYTNTEKLVSCRMTASDAQTENPYAESLRLASSTPASSTIVEARFGDLLLAAPADRKLAL
jgi:hypothetical protein